MIAYMRNPQNSKFCVYYPHVCIYTIIINRYIHNKHCYLSFIKNTYVNCVLCHAYSCNVFFFWTWFWDLCWFVYAWVLFYTSVFYFMTKTKLYLSSIIFIRIQLSSIFQYHRKESCSEQCMLPCAYVWEFL